MLRKIFTKRSLLAAMAIAVIAGSTPSAASTQKLVYDVKHAKYGMIGTYTNEVEKTGDSTKVTTQARIRISVLGVTLYRQNADREERWDKDRLVAFRGLTNIDGTPIELNGKAEGDRFVLQSPRGTVVAPANVKLANPWSSNVLKSNMVLTPDRGNLEVVEVKEGGRKSVTIKGRPVAVNYYQIIQEGRMRYEVWLDDQGTPVQFSVNNRNGLVTFTLKA